MAGLASGNTSMVRPRYKAERRGLYTRSTIILTHFKVSCSWGAAISLFSSSYGENKNITGRNWQPTTLICSCMYVLSLSLSLLLITTTLSQSQKSFFKICISVTYTASSCVWGTYINLFLLFYFIALDSGDHFHSVS
jgi:hypothetical protein